MKKAFKYMVTGSLITAAVMMYKNKETSMFGKLGKTMKNMKKTGINAINQIKDML